jgi:hypothetical protein
MINHLPYPKFNNAFANDLHLSKGYSCLSELTNFMVKEITHQSSFLKSLKNKILFYLQFLAKRGVNEVK